MTGGAGFIGSHIVQALLAKGLQVRVLDNGSTGDLERLRFISPQMEMIQGDIRDAADVDLAMRGVQTVFHLAALTSVPESVADPRLANAVNLDGTMNILEAMREHQAQRIVFSSSSAIYGDSPIMPKKESLFPEPRSPYAVTKWTAENYLAIYAKLFAVDGVSLRYFNVYGPRQSPHSAYAAVVPKFITTFLNDRLPIIEGDGLQTRDFIFVQDIVRANLLAATREHNWGGLVMNIGTGRSVSIYQVFAMLRQITKKEVDPHYVPARKGDVMCSEADVTYAREHLGFSASTSLSDGLLQTVEWYMQNR